MSDLPRGFARFIPNGWVERLVLTAVVDRTGGRRGSVVRAVFEEVEGRLRFHGHSLRLPVSIEIVGLSVMGATSANPAGHTLCVSPTAVDSTLLDGLIAHELGHMLLKEYRHPSHDPVAPRRILREIRLSRSGRRTLSQAFNHVQDIYADDIAFLAGIGDRAYGFFATWIRGNASQPTRDRWTDVSVSATNGFVLGNLARRGLLPADDELRAIARSLDSAAGFQAVDRFARFYETLPKDPSSMEFEARLHELAASVKSARDERRP